MSAQHTEVLRTDVAILGAGPAGFAAALALRKQGDLSVALLDRAPPGGRRVGETLSAAARPLLEALDLWPAFEAQAHLPAFGTAAAWGHSSLQARDFLMTPFGHGWNLDRSRFDAMLAETAGARGVELFSDCGWQSVHRENECWQLHLRSDAEASQKKPAKIHARFLIDASGRNAGLARHLGAQLHFLDQQIALTATLDLPADNEVDHFTVIEACALGWAYAVKIGEQSLQLALLTDGDLARAEGLFSPAAWWALLQSLPSLAPRLRGVSPPATLQSVAAHSGCLDRVYGESWLATGDAACSHDPLSGSGMVRAMESGVRAARAVHQTLMRDDTEALPAYQEFLHQAYQLYMRTRAQFYAQEQRWPASAYWQRRHLVLSLAPDTRLQRCAAARLPVCPADLLGLDLAGLLEATRVSRSAAELVAEYQGVFAGGAAAVIRALQWLVSVEVLQEAPR